MNAFVVTHGQYSDTSIEAVFLSREKAQAWIDARTDLKAKASGSAWWDGQDYEITEAELDPEPREGPRQHDLYPK